jgi:hypothetical protein
MLTATASVCAGGGCHASIGDWEETSITDPVTFTIPDAFRVFEQLIDMTANSRDTINTNATLRLFMFRMFITGSISLGVV